MSWPTVDHGDFQRHEPLKYLVGGEKTETLVLNSLTVAPDVATGRRVILAGTVLCNITGTELYGPYDDGAADGRETIAPGTTFVLVESHDVTFGDRAVAGYFQDCVFNTNHIIDAAGDKVVLDGAAFALLEAALPGCSFR